MIHSDQTGWVTCVIRVTRFSFIFAITTSSASRQTLRRYLKNVKSINHFIVHNQNSFQTAQTPWIKLQNITYYPWYLRQELYEVVTCHNTDKLLSLVRPMLSHRIPSMCLVSFNQTQITTLLLTLILVY